MSLRESSSSGWRSKDTARPRRSRPTAAAPGTTERQASPRRGGQGVRRRRVRRAEGEPGQREAGDHGEVGPDRPRAAPCCAGHARSSRRRRRTAAARRGSPRAPAAAGRAATNSPHSRICGITNAGMNCTAWNSVRANALTSRPSAVPSTASATATTTSSQTGPGDVEAEHPDREARRRAPTGRRPPARTPGRSRAGSRPCPSASRAAARGCPRCARAAWSTLVTRNITMNGKIAEQRRPDPVEDVAGQVVEHPPQQRRAARTAGPAAAPTCGGRGAAGCRTRPATASVTPRRSSDTRLGARRSGPGTPPRRRRRRCARAARAGVSSAMSCPSRISSSRSQRVGLVHHVAGDEHRGARRRRAGGTAPTGRGAAPGRGRRSARRAPAARARRAGRRRGETRDRWPPESRPTDLVAWLGEVDRLDGRGPTLARATPSTRAKKRRFSRDGEVVVDARRPG